MWIFSIKNHILIQISLRYVPWGQLTNIQQRFRLLPGARQVTGHYLNQFQPRSMTCMCISRSQGVNIQYITNFHVKSCDPLQLKTLKLFGVKMDEQNLVSYSTSAWYFFSFSFTQFLQSNFNLILLFVKSCVNSHTKWKHWHQNNNFIRIMSFFCLFVFVFFLGSLPTLLEWQSYDSHVLIPVSWFRLVALWCVR